MYENVHTQYGFFAFNKFLKAESFGFLFNKEQ